MKKLTKISAIILAVVMMCLCLGGCDELDDMRAAQAYWTNEGSVDSITYNGIEYKRIVVSTPPNPFYNTENVYSNIINVTDDDVPVLMSGIEGTTLNITDDKKFLHGYIYDTDLFKESSSNSLDSYTSEEVLYCKSDIYDDVNAKIQSGIEYTNYGYSYYEEDKNTGEYKYKYYYLSDKEVAAVNEVLDSTPTDSTTVASYIIGLDFVSDDKYFGLSYYYEIWCNDDGSYYLSAYNYYTDEYIEYAVPKELNSTFDSILRYANQYDSEYVDEEIYYAV